MLLHVFHLSITRYSFNSVSALVTIEWDPPPQSIASQGGSQTQLYHATPGLHSPVTISTNTTHHHYQLHTTLHYHYITV